MNRSPLLMQSIEMVFRKDGQPLDGDPSFSTDLFLPRSAIPKFRTPE